MPDNNNTWDDSEETIIHFGPKAKKMQSDTANAIKSDRKPLQSSSDEATNQDIKGLVYADRPFAQGKAAVSTRSSAPQLERALVADQKSGQVEPASGAAGNQDPPTIHDLSKLMKKASHEHEMPVAKQVKQKDSASIDEETSKAAFEGGSESVDDVAWVVIMKTPSVRKHQLYRLDHPRMEMGRAYDTPIYLDDKTVSMRHAAIRYETVNDSTEFVLYDLASTNGTLLNGTSVRHSVLKDGDTIKVGETEMVFKKV